MVNFIKQKYKIIAVLFLLVMLIGLIPFTATEAAAQEIDINATYNGDDSGFIEGQVMTIAIESRTNEVYKSNFFKYTYQGGEWVSNNPMKVSDIDAIEGVYAYVGFSDINEKELNECLNYDQFITDEDNLICDQSDDLLRYDWMIPAEEITLPTAENPVINAHFIHGLAKVTVGNIVYGTEYEETPVITDVRFKGFASSGFDITNNVFAGVSSNGIADVVPFEDTTNDTYTALLATNSEMNDNNEIIIPTEWTLLTLKVNGEEKTVKLVDNPETTLVNEAFLEAGTHYTFYLKVGKNKVTIVQVLTDDIGSPFGAGWDNDAEVGLDSSAASIGTQDVGKTNWVENDEIIVELYSSKYGTQYATLIYNGSQWNLNGSLLYLENEKPTVCAYYAPCNEVTGNTMNLRTGMLYGMTEYLEASDCQVVNNTISISFDGVIRDYSRLRIVGLPNQTLTVTTTGFTPAGASAAADGTTYTVTTNGDGNAFLYGTFAKDATVTVKKGTATLAEFAFSEEKGFSNGTEHNKSYALDARPVIDGTLGGKATATEDDIKALVEQIKYYVDNGISTIIVTGSEPATFYPVTAIGVEGFDNCLYLQKLTFGSVVTSIKDGTNSAFEKVGESVDGGLCDLVLNRGQASAATEYQPDVLNKRWWNNTYWKYIELR